MSAHLERIDQIQNLEQQNKIQAQNIKELSETNNHLIAATWRERELKQKLAASIKELQESKSIIEFQNKRISDSINYARRLQKAILPSSKTISSVLKDHFMIYKPKDVVSGDFPWMFTQGNYVYLGVVDCTGHGVPGAMLSMIGYLLLNTIASSSDNKTPAQILFELHQQIVKTLKQAVEGNNASDGMDIGLCRIDCDKREIIYSGAHRPLLVFTDAKVEQFKGDRYPIGGVQYKRGNNFTDKKLQLKQGDTFYLFSDGLPDQFGGPNGRKYGMKRLRDFISSNTHLPMIELQRRFNDEIEDWMEDERQLDDILLLGVRL